MTWTIQPDSEGFSWPSQQYNQIVEHSTTCLLVPIWHISRERAQKDDLQESVVSGSDMSCRDPGGLEFLGPYFFLCETDSKTQSCIWNPGRLTPESKFLDITSQCLLECTNCFVKQAGSSRWKMLWFSPVLKRITESEKWKWSPTSD